MTQDRTSEADSRAAPRPEAPLVVGLDALVRTNLTLEFVFAALGADPLRTLAFVVIHAFDRADFRAGLAEIATLDPAALPYDEDVLARIAQARGQGRVVALAAGADDRLAQAIARHLGMADPQPGFSGTAEPIAPLRPRQKFARILDVLRLEQWSKNLLVFVPIVTALKFNPASLTAALALFFAFSLCASAGYIFNDLIDLQADRAHPRKRRRPFAAADVPLAVGLALIPVLLAVAGGIALLLSPAVGVILLIYLATTITYSLVLKRKLLLDVITLGLLYTLRVYGGAVAIGVPLSGWLLLFSIFIFTSLALVKRCSEMTLRSAGGLSDPGNRDYKASDLPALLGVASAAAFSAVVIFALYVESDAVRAIYAHPENLLFAVPVLVYWLARLIILAHRGLIVVDPVVFALRDRASWACAIVTAAILASAV
jgi:4-hydroxybenzoate polyprenyltransferase